MKRVEIERQSLVMDDVFRVEEAWLRYERFDGSMSPVVRRLSFERGDSAAVLLYDRDDRAIVLVRQFRYPAHAKGPGWILETVAGVVEEGESPEQSIRREVLEETGHELDEVEHVATFYVSPGGSSERIILYYAEVDESVRIGDGRGMASEGEDIEEVRIAAEKVAELIAEGVIKDAKTLIAILWWLGRGGSSA